MRTFRDLRPGEACTITTPRGTRALIHRPGDRPIYLVYEEDGRRRSVAAVGTFTNWTSALSAARSGPRADTLAR